MPTLRHITIPSAQLVLQSGEIWLATSGDIIGRSRTAAITIADPRVSIAHATLDIRKGKVRLLRLRRPLFLRGHKVNSVVLEPGQRIAFAPEGVPYVDVLSVQHPTHVLALAGLDEDEVELSEDLVVIQDGPETFRVEHKRYHPHAIAHVYPNGDGNWDIHMAGHEPETIYDGWEGSLGGKPIRAQARPLSGAHEHEPSTYRSLRIVVRLDSVQIDHGSSDGPLIIGGKPAQIFSEVALCEGPVRWEAIARQIWRGEADLQLLRWRLNRNVQLLRRKLQAAGLSPDLLHRNGDGNLELRLGPDDVVIDET